MLTPVLVCARSELRRRWRAWVGLALIIGIGAGLVLTGLAGARRTETAYLRFLDRQQAADVLLAGASAFGLVGGVDLDQVAQLPHVADAAHANVHLLFTGRMEGGRALRPADLLPVSSTEGKLGTEVDRWKILEGRRADPDRIDEATASFLLAEELGLEVGDTVRLRFFRAESFVSVAGQLLGTFGDRLLQSPGSNAISLERLADGPDITFTIVGIEAAPSEFPPQSTDVAPPLHLTPAFDRAHAEAIVGSPVLYARLRPDAGINDFTSRVEELAQGEPVSFVYTRANQSDKVQRSIRFEANAARLLAGLTAVAVLVIVAQTLGRSALVEAADDPVLWSVGLSPRQLWWLGMLRSVVPAFLGAAIAAAFAVALSPLMPIGLARTAELDPGFAVDGLVIGAGAVVTAALVLLLALPAAYQAAIGAAHAPGSSPARRPVRRSKVLAALTGAGLPPAATVGIRQALEPGRGRVAVPVRTTLLGLTLAVAMVSATWCVASSLNHLLATPRLYGFTWDLNTGAPGLPDLGGVLVPALQSDPTISDLAAGTTTLIDVEGVRVDTMALDQTTGVIVPTVVGGRRPEGPDEIMLGIRTLEDTGAAIGDQVEVRIGDSAMTARVVGRAVFPDVGDAAELGTGALLTYQGLQQILPEAQQNEFLVRFREGVDQPSAFARIRAALDPIPARPIERPNDLRNVARLDSLPIILGAILALLAAATLAHSLLTSTRRRRRDLAVLKSLGFLRRQVSFTVVWQATTLCAMALVIGLPLGTAVGRWGWTLFAEQLGTVPEPVVPPLPLLLMVPATVLVVNAIAAGPAWLAGRTRSALALRAE